MRSLNEQVDANNVVTSATLAPIGAAVVTQAPGGIYVNGTTTARR